MILDANQRIGDSWRTRTGTRCGSSRRRATTACPVGRSPLPRGRTPRHARPPTTSSSTRTASSFRCDPACESTGWRRRATGSSSRPASSGFWRTRRRRDGVPRKPYRPRLRLRARPTHRPDALERVPRPVAARTGGVLIVGAGNSGADIAIELARRTRRGLSGRDMGEVPIRIESRLARVVIPVLWFLATTCSR